MVKDIAVNYKEMREENINGVLAQNTKLIEECNKLRKMNEEFKRNIKNYEKELSDLLRKKDKVTQIKKIDDSMNLKGINKKLEEHELRINDQKQELATMNEQIKEIIKSKS
jgi:chromosome segregation ATPase